MNYLMFDFIIHPTGEFTLQQGFVKQSVREIQLNHSRQKHDFSTSSDFGLAHFDFPQNLCITEVFSSNG